VQKLENLVSQLLDYVVCCVLYCVTVCCQSTGLCARHLVWTSRVNLLTRNQRQMMSSLSQSRVQQQIVRQTDSHRATPLV